MKNKMHHTNRREFVDYSAKGATGLIGLRFLKPPAMARAGTSASRSRVVVVKHENASAVETIDRQKQPGCGSGNGEQRY